MVWKIEAVGHKIFMENYFTSPKLLNDPHDRKINGCGTVRHNRKEMPRNFSPKYLGLKRGETVSRVRGRPSEKLISFLAEVNFTESGKAVKSLIIEDYTTHMGYVDLSDEMAHSYSICKITWKWTNKLFFHLSNLLDITILNSYAVYKSCGGNTTPSARCSLPRDVSRGRPALRRQMDRLQVKYSLYWESKGKERSCHVRQLKSKTKIC
jgi:hypothetical protein